MVIIRDNMASTLYFFTKTCNYYMKLTYIDENIIMGDHMLGHVKKYELGFCDKKRRVGFPKDGN